MLVWLFVVLTFLFVQMKTLQGQSRSMKSLCTEKSSDLHKNVFLLPVFLSITTTHAYSYTPYNYTCTLRKHEW